MDGRCRIEMLGGLQIDSGGRRITRFRTHKTASLLAYLAYHLGQRQPREVLAEMLWPGCVPELGRQSLSMALSSLRKQLAPAEAPAHALLQADRFTVALDAGLVSTDVAEFRCALHAAIQSPDRAARIGCLRRGVDLCRGPLLPGFYEDWVIVEQRHIDALYVEALCDLVRLLMADGRDPEAAAYALRGLEVDPQIQELHLALMRVHQRAGRAGAALEQFDALTRAAAEVGDTPCREAADLARALRRDPDGAAHPAAAPSAGPAPHRPLRLSRFVGRDGEMQALLRTLSPANGESGTARPILVTLVGPAGCGKTRLAAEVACALWRAYAERACVVDLAGVHEAAAIGAAAARAMGLAAGPNQEPLAAVERALAERPWLLVLDNMEHLLPDAAPMVERLAGAAEGTRLAVTSRRRLEVEGEREFPVAPLPTPAGARELAELARCPSVALFIDRAQMARPEFQRTERNAPALAALCERLEGLPLAIELAAARVRIFTPEQMLAQQEDRFSFLVSLRRQPGHRHRTLHAALDWSYRLLPPDQQRLFRRLSVFPGPWTAEAARQVCGEPGALASLEELCAWSLASAEEDGDTMRFRMLETLREFGGALLDPEECAEAERRHTEWVREAAEQRGAGASGADQAAWLDRLDGMTGDLRAALARCLRPGADPEQGLRIAAAVWRYWEVRGLAGEGRRWLEALLALPEACESPWADRALLGAGSLARDQADYAHAALRLEQALARFRARGDQSSAATCLSTLGLVAWGRGDIRAARAYHEEALAIRRTQGPEHVIAASLSNLGLVVWRESDYPAAAALFREALDLHRQVGDELGATIALGNLAGVLDTVGDYEAARSAYAESLAICRRLGDAEGIAFGLGGLASVAMRLCDYAEARRLYHEKEADCRERGDRRGLADTLTRLGEMCIEERDFAGSRPLLEEALALYEPMGETLYAACARQALAAAAAAAGDWEAARDGLLRSGRALRDIGDREVGAGWLERVAGVLADRGDPAFAARLLGAADAENTALGLPTPPDERAGHDEQVGRAREALGGPAFEAAFEAGRSLSLDDAMALALDRLAAP